MEKLADIGLIGLAVMGENLVLNMESHGYTVAVFNRTAEKVDKFISGRCAGKFFIEQLIPFLEEGDIIIDGGNTHYPDTCRRTKYVEEKGLLYIVTGVYQAEKKEPFWDLQ